MGAATAIVSAMNRLALGSLLALACGCGAPSTSHEGQSRLVAMRIVCDAPLTCEPARSAPASARMTIMAHWMSQHVTNEEVLALLRELGSLEWSMRAPRLREAATAVGLESCAFADEME